MADTFNVHVFRENGAYVADASIPLPGGRWTTIRLKCSFRDAARELGYDPIELGATFNASDPDEWWRLIEASDDGGDGYSSTVGAVERSMLTAEVGGKLGQRIKKRFRKFGKRLGKAFRKFAKSKVIRGICRIGKKILKNPIFTGIASALTGGLAAPALMGATAAINIIDVAKSGKKKKDKAAARKLIKLALAAEKQEQLAKLQKLPRVVKAKGQVKDGPWEGIYATPTEVKKMDALLLQVARARKERKREELAAKKAQPIQAKAMPPIGDTQRWLVQLGGLEAW
jgi:hypothetical protein